MEITGVGLSSQQRCFINCLESLGLPWDHHHLCYLHRSSITSPSWDRSTRCLLYSNTVSIWHSELRTGSWYRSNGVPSPSTVCCDSVLDAAFWSIIWGTLSILVHVHIEFWELSSHCLSTLYQGKIGKRLYQAVLTPKALIAGTSFFQIWNSVIWKLF